MKLAEEYIKRFMVVGEEACTFENVCEASARLQMEGFKQPFTLEAHPVDFAVYRGTMSGAFPERFLPTMPTSRENGMRINVTTDFPQGEWRVVYSESTGLLPWPWPKS